MMMNLIVPKLEYAGEVWEGNAKLVKTAENSTDDIIERSAKMLKHDE